MRAYLPTITRLQAERTTRSAILPTLPLRDPCWDMLLDLSRAAALDDRLCTKALCIGAQVHTTTALRYIDQLASAGLIERQQDNRDMRLRWAYLSSQGHAAMGAFFAQVEARP